MPQATCAIVLSLGGSTIQKSIIRSGDHPNPYEVSLPAGIAGQLTTRTDNDTGIVTVASHSIVDTDTVDLYWAGGRRYGVDVTAVTATTISIDAGAGDNLPVATTAVVIVKQVQINAAIDGDQIEILGLALEFTDPSETSKGHITFKDSGGASVANLDLSANTPAVYDVAGRAAQPAHREPNHRGYASYGSSASAPTLEPLSLKTRPLAEEAWQCPGHNGREGLLNSTPQIPRPPGCNGNSGAQGPVSTGGPNRASG